METTKHISSKIPQTISVAFFANAKLISLVYLLVCENLIFFHGT